MSSSVDPVESLLSHKIQRDELEAGDHIYSWRSLYIYSHHGIYVGEGKVIHFTGGGMMKRSLAFRPNCRNCGDKVVRANGVQSSCLDCFLRKGKLRRYRYGVSAADFFIKVRGGCTTAASDQPEAVIYRANYLLENDGFGKYNFLRNNCEDFSLYCKTEIARESSESTGCSSQTKYVRAFFSAFVKKPAKFAIHYCQSRLRNDIGVRADVRRISVEELCAQKAKAYVDSDSEEWFVALDSEEWDATSDSEEVEE